MPPKPKLGIIAGGGRLPLEIVDACRAENRPFFVVVLQGQANAVDYVSTDHVELRLGAAGSAAARFKQEGCVELVMAGTVKRPGLKDLRPDLWTIGFFARSGAAALGDDGLLKALIKATEKEGFRVVGADELLPNLLAPKGQLGACSPTPAPQCDIDAAIAAALELGARDVGQAAVARDGHVIGREDEHGTDAMLTSLEDSAVEGSRRGVLAKVKKPNQERRADLPTIGLSTIEGAARAGLAGIVVEAGGALVMERQALIERADAMGLFVVGHNVSSNSGEGQ